MINIADKKWISGFAERFRKNYWIFFFIMLIQSIVIYKVNYVIALHIFGGNELRHIMFCALGAVLSTVVYSLVIQFVVSVVGGGISKVLSWIFIFLATFITISEIFLINKYNKPITLGILNSFFSSNSRESFEFLESLKLSIIYKELIIIAIISVISYFFSKIRFSKIVFYIFLGCQLLSTVVYSYRYFPEYIKYYREKECCYFAMSSFDRILYNYALNKKVYAMMQNSFKQVSSNSFKNFTVDENIDDINVVIILGETLRRNSMHCYGCNVPNTPNIDSLVSSGDILLFKDVTTSGANTNISIRQTFTFYDNINNNKKDWFEYPTLFNALKKAGYYTYWVSNQESGGSKYVSDVVAIANTCRDVKFTKNINLGDEVSDSKGYDENLLPFLKSGNNIGQHKFATVIHLMGSHNAYKCRYPEKFDRFTADNSIVDKNLKENTQIAMEYYNSILYNDYVVSKIIDFYKNYPSIVFYFSDHGEDLFDNPEHPDVHDHATSPYSAPVPFMVYVSPEIRQRNGVYDDIVHKIENAKDKPISLDMFSNSLMDLLRIHTEYDSDFTQCFSEDYISPKRRAVVGLSEDVELFIDTIRTVPDYWDYKIRH